METLQIRTFCVVTDMSISCRFDSLYQGLVIWPTMSRSVLTLPYTRYRREIQLPTKIVSTGGWKKPKTSKSNNKIVLFYF